MSILALQPTVLRWARERAGLDVSALAEKIKTKPQKVQDWELTGKLTFGQMEHLAQHTHTPSCGQPVNVAAKPPEGNCFVQEFPGTLAREFGRGGFLWHLVSMSSAVSVLERSYVNACLNSRFSTAASLTAGR